MWYEVRTLPSPLRVGEHLQQEGVQLVVDHGREGRVLLEVARQEPGFVKGKDLLFFERGRAEAPARFVVARDLTHARYGVLQGARTALEHRTRGGGGG